MQLARHSMRPTGTITPSSWPRCSEWSEDAAIWSKRNGLTRRMEPPRRSKRARKAHDTSSDRAPLHELLSHAKLTIFSGAGISVSSGIPTFTEARHRVLLAAWPTPPLSLTQRSPSPLSRRRMASTPRRWHPWG